MQLLHYMQYDVLLRIYFAWAVNVAGYMANLERWANNQHLRLAAGELHILEQYKRREVNNGEWNADASLHF